MSRARSQGAALVVVLVMLLAGTAVAASVASFAAQELALAGGSVARLRALQAADAGLATALAARGWSADGPWRSTGQLEGSEWTAEVRLVAARIGTDGGPVEWLFEIESNGRHGAARASFLQGFSVHGPLPGEPQPGWWRQLEPGP
jgi:hypothetical protein